jgi:hypothetical protein
VPQAQSCELSLQRPQDAARPSAMLQAEAAAPATSPDERGAPALLGPSSRYTALLVGRPHIWDPHQAPCRTKRVSALADMLSPAVRGASAEGRQPPPELATPSGADATQRRAAPAPCGAGWRPLPPALEGADAGGRQAALAVLVAGGRPRFGAPGDAGAVCCRLALLGADAPLSWCCRAQGGAGGPCPCTALLPCIHSL